MSGPQTRMTRDAQGGVVSAGLLALLTVPLHLVPPMGVSELLVAVAFWAIWLL